MLAKALRLMLAKALSIPLNNRSTTVFFYVASYKNLLSFKAVLPKPALPEEDWAIMSLHKPLQWRVWPFSCSPLYHYTSTTRTHTHEESFSAIITDNVSFHDTYKSQLYVATWAFTLLQKI